MQKKEQAGAATKNLKIKTARMGLNMSQEELAGKVGATRQTIGPIEARCYSPTVELCIKIYIALHKYLDGLFWEDDYDKGELQDEDFTTSRHYPICENQG